MMLQRTSTPLNGNRSVVLQSKRIDSKEQCAKNTNILNDMLRQGKNMNEKEFEEFIRVHASNCYWEILAERARLQLEDQLRDNRQLHQLVNELTKENEQLQVKNEHCEYLTNIFNSIISESDSGIDIHSIDESPLFKRKTIHF